MNNQWFSKVAVWLVIALVLFTVFKQFEKPRSADTAPSYTQFMDDARAGKIKRVEVQQGGVLTVTPKDGTKYTIVSPGDSWMTGDLMKYG
ncbi:MAG: ATP-dependent metallopeptidase FtsH/Yme1/Tma family protein, partial [Betaproteobacteria bacterium]|nr:ATP-dependent metallopeptidase FtsH/Yme1/Tma family protein [Betaproteobacteria bacterium]